MFFDCMRNLLATAEKEAAILTLLGDMNAKHPSWQTSGPHNMAGAKLFNLLLDFGMTQCVEDPTRFSPDGDRHSVIDVYATNHPDLVTAINVSDPIDHLHNYGPGTRFGASQARFGCVVCVSHWSFRFSSALECRSAITVVFLAFSIEAG